MKLSEGKDGRAQEFGLSAIVALLLAAMVAPTASLSLPGADVATQRDMPFDDGPV